MTFSRNVDNGPRREQGRVVDFWSSKDQNQGSFKNSFDHRATTQQVIFRYYMLCFFLSPDLYISWPRESWRVISERFYFILVHKALESLYFFESIAPGLASTERAARTLAASHIQRSSGREQLWLTIRVPLGCSEPPSIEFWPFYHSLSELRCSWDMLTTLTCLFFTDLAVFLAVKKTPLRAVWCLQTTNTLKILVLVTCVHTDKMAEQVPLTPGLLLLDSSFPTCRLLSSLLHRFSSLYSLLWLIYCWVRLSF